MLLEQGGRRTWSYEYPRSRGRRLAGAGLCYRRSLCRRNPFPELRVGEDTRFVVDAHSVRTVEVDDRLLLMAVVHGANTSPKATSGPWFTPCPVVDVARLMGNDFAAYNPLGLP